MKKTLLSFIITLTLVLAASAPSFAQADAATAPAAADSAKPAAPRKARKNRKKIVKQAPAADAAAVQEAAQAPAAPKNHGKRPLMKEPLGSVSGERPVIKTLDTRKANSLLFATMERLETLIAYYDNLQLQVSANTVNKIAELQTASNKAAADFFKTSPPDPVRETMKPYKTLLNSALKSVKILKDIKDRVIPEETEKALAICRELNAAIDGELAAAKLTAPAASAAAAPAEEDQEESKPAAPAASGPAAAGGAELSGEAGALATLAELRKAVEDYKAAEGKFPKTLKKLTPKYMPEMPAISVADHPTTDEVLEIDSTDYDDNLHQAITDSGKWLYFTNKKSRYYGQVFIDCSHKNAKGVELFREGEAK